MADLMHIEVNRQVREAAVRAMEAIAAVLSDPKIRTHGLTQSQWAALDEARDTLGIALS